MIGPPEHDAHGRGPEGAENVRGDRIPSLQSALDRQQKLIEDLNDEVKRLRAELAEADFVARVGMGVIVGVQLDQLTHGQREP